MLLPVKVDSGNSAEFPRRSSLFANLVVPKNTNHTRTHCTHYDKPLTND